MDLKNIQHPTPNIEHPMGEWFADGSLDGEICWTRRWGRWQSLNEGRGFDCVRAGIICRLDCTVWLWLLPLYWSHEQDYLQRAFARMGIYFSWAFAGRILLSLFLY